MSKTKIVLITGGMGDIAQAIAKKLTEENFTVALLYNKNKNSDFFSKLNGKNNIAIKCDITKPSDIKKTIKKIDEKYGKIDICIHCAVSPLVRKKMSDIKTNEFKQQFKVTVFGGLNIFQSVIPLIKKSDNGKIIALTSSALTDKKVTGMAGYVSSKFALVGVLRELSKELLSDKIEVNAVAPKFVPTSLHKDLPKNVLEFMKERSPIDTKEGVAKKIFELCLDGKEFETGMSYPVNEGEIKPL